MATVRRISVDGSQARVSVVDTGFAAKGVTAVPIGSNCPRHPIRARDGLDRAVAAAMRRRIDPS